MVSESEMRKWPRRVTLLVVAAVGAGCVLLIVHHVGKARTERLGEDIVVLASGSAPPAAIERLRAAGPCAAFEALKALMGDMVDKPSREWTLNPRDTLKALIKLHGAGSAEAAGAEESIVRRVTSAVIIPGSTHDDLWVHPNLVTIPGNPIQMELALRSTDRRGRDRHTIFNYFRTDDDFRSLHPIDNPTSADWRLIGLTPADFNLPPDGSIELPEGEWHWARNAAFLDSTTIVYPFLTRDGGRRSVRTLAARQRGEQWVPLYISNALTNEAGRGLLEPHIVRHKHRLFMTMRAEDGFGYVSVSADNGRSWSEPQAWRWDDGKKIPMHTTMTKLLSHSDGMLLVYTRIREDNKNVFRHRAPLHCADVTPRTLSLRRVTERVIIPNRGLPVGNFWVWPIDQAGSYVCASEWPRDGRAANGDTWLAKIYWKRPNQRMSTDGRRRAAGRESSNKPATANRRAPVSPCVGND